MAREKKSTRSTKGESGKQTAESRSGGAGKGRTKRSAATRAKGASPAKRTPRQGRPKTKPLADVVTGSGPSLAEIRQRAYEIYLRRGGEGGDPTADWFQAERELQEEMAQRGR